MNPHHYTAERINALYTAGRINALYTLGVTKIAQAPNTTYLEQGLEKAKKYMPKTPTGRAAALGAALGLGMGVHSLTKNRNKTEEMEAPNFYSGSALLYPQEY